MPSRLGNLLISTHRDRTSFYQKYCYLDFLQYQALSSQKAERAMPSVSYLATMDLAGVSLFSQAKQDLSLIERIHDSLNTMELNTAEDHASQVQLQLAKDRINF